MFRGPTRADNLFAFEQTALLVYTLDPGAPASLWPSDFELSPDELATFTAQVFSLASFLLRDSPLAEDFIGSADGGYLAGACRARSQSLRRSSWSVPTGSHDRKALSDRSS
jgi:hypothetical protein